MQIPVIYDNEIETMSFCSDTPRSRVIFQLEYPDQERADRVLIGTITLSVATYQIRTRLVADLGSKPCRFELDVNDLVGTHILALLFPIASLAHHDGRQVPRFLSHHGYLLLEGLPPQEGQGNVKQT